MEQPSQAEDNQSQISPSTQSVPEEVETETVAPSQDVSSSSPAVDRFYGGSAPAPPTSPKEQNRMTA